MSNNRTYVIFDVSELGTIDFSQVLEDSIDTVRKSLDGTQTFVKYVGDMPSSVSALTTRSQEYNYEQILTILAGPDWTSPED